MKKAILALLLAGVLSLTGCSSMLEQKHLLDLKPYDSVSSSPGSASLRVETYQELYRAIHALVSTGEEHAVLNLYHYSAQDLESDLARACLDVVQNDPLGAYMVDYIKHDYSLIVSYYEVNINVAYRHTAEELDAIVSVTGSSAIRRELRKTLAKFSTDAVLRVSYFAEDEDHILDLVRQAYYDTPLAAFGMPDATVSLYPSGGTNRIVEIHLTYPDNQETLRRRSKELKEAVSSIALSDIDARALFDTASTNLIIEENTGLSTAHDALINGVSDSEGAALAYQLLCDQTGVECTIVQGTLNGDPHFWNIITEDGTLYRHVDLSAKLFSLSDLELTQTGAYEWDRAQYPTCDSPAEEVSDTAQEQEQESEKEISEN